MMIERKRIEFRMVGKHHRIPASSIQKCEFLDEDHMAVVADLANSMEPRLNLSVTLADANIPISRTLARLRRLLRETGSTRHPLERADSRGDHPQPHQAVQLHPEAADILVDRLSAYLPTALVEINKREEARVAKVDMDPRTDMSWLRHSQRMLTCC